ncbi:astacin [Cooperia oncophora]
MPTSLLKSIVNSANLRQKRTAFRNAQYPVTIWKNGVPFAFHRSLKAAGRRSVLAAIQFFRHHTCIRFKRRKREKVYLLFTGHDEGCWSTVGRDPWQQQQLISIGPGCEPFGISSHEVAHALGLFHEQSRYDRDNWITVYPGRVPQSFLYNYAKVGRRQMSPYATPYDIGSVMHYTPFEYGSFFA